MNKIFIKSVFLVLFITICVCSGVYAQTITVQNIDPGPYAPGSTMAVPVNVNSSGSCIAQNNTFKLFLSDKNGNFPGTQVATVTGFYITFMNFTIPGGTPAGTGYKVRITSSSNPGATVVASSAFEIKAGTAVTAAITAGFYYNKTDIFGPRNSTANYEFDYSDNSSTGSSSVKFFNEKTQSVQATNPSAASGSFNADQTNYTVIVRAAAGGIVGTKAYPLINNPAASNFGSSGSNATCLSAGGATISFPIITVSNPPSGSDMVDNYPGDTYLVTWGDGTTSTYTLCEIMSAGNSVTHNYIKSSCGVSGGPGIPNAFPVGLQPQNSYAGLIGARSGSSARVATIPKNLIGGPTKGCANTVTQFTNESDPGSDPNSNSSSCVNTNARYSWYVDGVLKQANSLLTDVFNYTFTTAGTYHITLELQNSSSPCSAPAAQFDICIQKKPTPAFTIQPIACIGSGPVTPVNNSLVPPQTCTPTPFTWSVTPSTGVTISNVNDAAPQFTFTKTGVYTVNLKMPDACGDVLAATQQTITVDAPPAATLSADVNLCGANNQTLTFDPSATETKTTYTGTADNAATYQWTVTPSGGAGAATFAGGTTATSQYPQITFPDYGTYSVSVKVTNACGSVISNIQKITFTQAPIVDPGAPQTVCANSTIRQTGTVTPAGSYNSVTWTSDDPAGVFSAPHALTTNYQPTQAEIDAGKVTLTLTAFTSLTDCSQVSKSVDITLTPINTITSSPTASICSGNAVNYTPKDKNNSSSFTWTVDQANTTATGWANGSGTKITDVLTNLTSADEKVTYLITPNGGTCNASNFVLTVTVKAGVLTPSFTFTPAGPYCGANTITFTNTSTPISSQFTWDFGDGTVSHDVNPPPHSFPVPTNGKSFPYHVILSITGGCNNPPAYKHDITINPAVPVPQITPVETSACGPTTLHIHNTSPGSNINYTFHLIDTHGDEVDPPVPMPDKSDVSFNVNATTSTTYYEYMVVTDSCGNTAETAHLPISVSPSDINTQMFPGGATTGCAPYTTTFLNNSSAGTSFYYTITNTADNTSVKVAAVLGSQQYTFNNAGTYTVQLFASDDCVKDQPSAPVTYLINPQPQPSFTYTTDCGNTATFVNTTPDPDNSIGYSWDFGDGSPVINDKNPAHTYTYDASHTHYIITLTATNTSTTCSNTTTQDINVSQTLTAIFDVLPSTTINIPNYHFDFVDRSTGNPTSWLWSFGDGATSTLPNPGHTYAYGNVGTHTVTLTVKNQNCTSAPVSQGVMITGVPGQLYLPNAFIPSSSTVALQTFMAKGSGIKTWHLQIFNNYGQLIWETTKLDANGSPAEGWDGNYKGAPAPQGSYLWQASATFINGSQWKGMSYNGSLPKRTGSVNLIR